MKDPTIPPLIEANQDIQVSPCTVEQALARVRQDRGLVLGARGDKNTLVWLSGDAKRPLQRSDQQETSRICEELDARAREALKILENNKARGKAVLLLEHAANEAWGNQQPPVTAHAWTARQRLLKDIKKLQKLLPQLQQRALEALVDGGDAVKVTVNGVDLPDLKMIEKLLSATHAMQAPIQALPALWEHLKKRRPGKPATPALNKATKELLVLFSQAGCSQRKARIYAHALLRAAGLLNSDEPDTIKGKLSTL